MASIDKSTITVKTSAAVTLFVAGLVVHFLTTRYAVQLEMEKLHGKIDNETTARIGEDRQLDVKIANNAKLIDKLETRIEALRPTTVTTFR